MATVEQAAAARRFEHLLLDFLGYLEFERGLSRNTLEAYRTDLLQFGRFLEARGVSALDAGPGEVTDFLELAGARRRRAGARVARHDSPQVRLPALVLPPSAPRRPA